MRAMTFDLCSPKSNQSLNGCLCQTWGKCLRVLLRYHVHKKTWTRDASGSDCCWWRGVMKTRYKCSMIYCQAPEFNFPILCVCWHHQTILSNQWVICQSGFTSLCENETVQTTGVKVSLITHRQINMEKISAHTLSPQCELSRKHSQCSLLSQVIISARHQAIKCQHSLCCPCYSSWPWLFLLTFFYFLLLPLMLCYSFSCTFSHCVASPELSPLFMPIFYCTIKSECEPVNSLTPNVFPFSTRHEIYRMCCSYMLSVATYDWEIIIRMATFSCYITLNTTFLVNMCVGKTLRVSLASVGND